MEAALHAYPLADVSLLPDLGRIDYAEMANPFRQRAALTRAYLMSLTPANLLRPYRHEAGFFGGPPEPLPAPPHQGWESLESQLRGHFLGHWLSAAARLSAVTGDAELAARADTVIAGVADCQRENDGEWAFSIPEKYLHRIAAGKPTWAPHYTIHKTLMGLLDAHRYLGSGRALDVARDAASWFHRWTATVPDMDEVLDTETGGMLEAWTDLYAVTGEPPHLDLIHRYTRRRLFDRLLAGEDPLTNRHANTTIPEVLGAARAYEVTGDERWRDITLAYWDCAVTRRGYFATGGQGSYEMWTPPHELAARLGDRTQEHCTVYNMMRLADVLLRWTGEHQYADYIERNLYNGIFAQQHPRTGMVCYYLPLRPGGRKKWGTPTDSFWCCHGTMVQAHSRHDAYIYYQGRDGITVAQYIPSSLVASVAGTQVRIEQRPDPEIGTHIAAGDNTGAIRRPQRRVVMVTVRAEVPAEFTLRLRVPWWVQGSALIRVNDSPGIQADPGEFATLRRAWRDDTIRIELPSGLHAEPLPDRPDTVAFMDGPVVLAGLCADERGLSGNAARPEEILWPDDERDPFQWNGGYRTRGQAGGLRFVPLHEVEDEAYTVYFPVRP
jgi:DUF1680 family protein